MDSRAGALGSLGVGALCAVAAALLRDGCRVEGVAPGSATRSVAVWTVDRDAGAAYGLDDDLILVRRIRMDWPLEVSARRDGGAWVLRSCDGTPDGPSRLVRIDREGRIAVEIPLEPCSVLDQLDDGSAILLGAGRILAVSDSGDLTELARGEGFRCLCPSGRSIVVGTVGGEVLRIATDGTGNVLGRHRIGVPLVDLAPGPSPRCSWALAGSDRRRVHLLGPDLRVRWSADAGSARTCIAPVSGEERVWLVDESVPSARRLGASGAAEIEIAGPAGRGLERAVSTRGGGLLVATPGAVLRWDGAGRMQPGQGGFAGLVDLDRAPRAGG